jgi:hypothetical protein
VCCAVSHRPTWAPTAAVRSGCSRSLSRALIRVRSGCSRSLSRAARPAPSAHSRSLSRGARRARSAHSRGARPAPSGRSRGASRDRRRGLAPPPATAGVPSVAGEDAAVMGAAGGAPDQRLTHEAGPESRAPLCHPAMPRGAGVSAARGAERGERRYRAEASRRRSSPAPGAAWPYAARPVRLRRLPMA